jgi:hypothetical protein
MGVQPICTKGVNVRDDLLHDITIWRLRKGENVRLGNHENKGREEEPT